MEQSIMNQKGKDSDSPTKDKLFDPSIDMLVNDFDDERTLDEEEALAAGESNDPSVELSDLQKEGNMPLEELLALYGYSTKEKEGSSDEEEETGQNSSELMEDEESEPLPPEQQSKLSALYEPIVDNDNEASSRLLRSVSRISEEEDDDYDYSPDEDEVRKMKKTIMVGSDYQAQIPEGLHHYDDVLPYENDDKLVWDPSKIALGDTEDYLKKAHLITKPPLPSGTHLRDDEQALYMLQQCGHNAKEALRRLRMTLPTSSTDSVNESLWSEEECRNFEAGVRSFGKNFHLIQQNKVRTRSVGELVQFYYLWKKSERHDIFANKVRLEKKKYSLHPGLTDFMDRFLEDQERDRSSSPIITAGNGSTKPPPDI
ncbi:mesoderm induction early response protein 1 [Cylas formicarius]|uniref:mesoderm induction early response protein 1 n=1 Tax=Cylas formicarius TaxID=197179 RepID=UPI002958A9A0|nr:mesoderm induction early response protein 1 [Cylas formicarius]